jgi:hypothetical protein
MSNAEIIVRIAPRQRAEAQREREPEDDALRSCRLAQNRAEQDQRGNRVRNVGEGEEKIDDLLARLVHEVADDGANRDVGKEGKRKPNAVLGITPAIRQG